MARLNTLSFPCYFVSCSAERGVSSVFTECSGQESSSDFKYKSRESLATILNVRNARGLFIMAKRHPVRNSQCIKAIRDVHSFFQEESFKIRSNQPV
jgi:hypothetical protein